MGNKKDPWFVCVSDYSVCGEVLSPKHYVFALLPILSIVQAFVSLSLFVVFIKSCVMTVMMILVCGLGCLPGARLVGIISLSCKLTRWDTNFICVSVLWLQPGTWQNCVLLIGELCIFLTVDFLLVVSAVVIVLLLLFLLDDVFYIIRTPEQGLLIFLKLLWVYGYDCCCLLYFVTKATVSEQNLCCWNMREMQFVGGAHIYK